VLETIRDYAHEKLEQSGELAATAVLHCHHYFALAKAAREGLRGAEQADWIYRVETELDNVRAAMALALSGGSRPDHRGQDRRGDAGLLDSSRLLDRRSQAGRGSAGDPAVREAEPAQGHALVCRRRPGRVPERLRRGAVSMLENCLALRRRLGNPLDIAATLSTLSMARLPLGDSDGARTAEEEALGSFVRSAIARARPSACCISARSSSTPAMTRGIKYLDDCLTLARAIKQQELEGDCERELGEIALDADDRPAPSRTEAFADDLSRRRRQARVAPLPMVARQGRAARGRHDGARRSLAAALAAFRASRCAKTWSAPWATGRRWPRPRDAFTLAVQLTAAVDHASERLALRRPRARRPTLAGHVESLRASMPPASSSCPLAGHGWDIDEALRKARSSSDGDASAERTSDEEALASSTAEDR
jgi:hypothetical protein